MLLERTRQRDVDRWQKMRRMSPLIEEFTRQSGPLLHWIWRNVLAHHNGFLALVTSNPNLPNGRLIRKDVFD